MPQPQVFIDGRGDVFDPTGIPAYGRWAIWRDPNLLLENIKSGFVCYPKMSHSTGIAYLAGWRQAYSDDLATSMSVSQPSQVPFRTSPAAVGSPSLSLSHQGMAAPSLSDILFFALMSTFRAAPAVVGTPGRQ
jgi:hypothetical protein